jgi:hypothetical protein
MRDIMNERPILDTIRDSYGRVVYTHKTYEKQLEIMSFQLAVYRWVRFIVIALTATGAISVLITNTRWLEIVTALFGSLSLLLTLYGLGFAPEKVISDYRRVARRLWHVRERYLHLISDLVSGNTTDEEAIQLRRKLTDELAEIYLDAPDTTSRAYQRARKALRVSEEMSFADQEIDEFLPNSLKKASS